MKKLLPILLFVIISAIACKKSDTAAPTLEGVWVEKSLRLDTLNFTYGDLLGPAMYLQSTPYNDTVLNPNYPVNHSSIYTYLVAGDTMRLRNFLSLSTSMIPYRFTFSAGGTMVSIGKFYNRRSLASIVDFEKIR